MSWLISCDYLVTIVLSGPRVEANPRYRSSDRLDLVEKCPWKAPWFLNTGILDEVCFPNDPFWVYRCLNFSKLLFTPPRVDWFGRYFTIFWRWWRGVCWNFMSDVNPTNLWVGMDYLVRCLPSAEWINEHCNVVELECGLRVERPLNWCLVNVVLKSQMWPTV